MKQLTISTPHITLIVLNYGAIIQKLLVKDANGNTVNVVMGHDNAADYLTDERYLGAVVGRYAGRISNGSFELDRQIYHLHQENGVHLHGGKEGFSKKYWTFEDVHYGNEPYIKLSYTSAHLEEGYPGNVKVSVTYKLKHNQLHMVYEATTDRTTVINLTNHSYFRLDDAPNLAAHKLQLNCSKYAELDAKLVPTGKLLSVRKTEMDFREPANLGNISLNHPFLVDRSTRIAARMSSRFLGIMMEVLTDQPVLIVYTPPDMPAICFEAQNFPDAPNRPKFPSSVLRPNDVYTQATQYRFDVL
ncbi:galactose mutarotase [Aggregatimonas sangjinii]|uniref:Galactose mutarotase n=1 Tax=Aggregatimonas sangjinii TaxID=2583587 RepID=A0A5B7SQC3_9FLAO|nr:aldose epimerase family protein [Aggregatimonas sangjinii]QCX00747.1 galactose mutarotase [Aggregatimonas sangjinii]